MVWHLLLIEDIPPADIANGLPLSKYQTRPCMVLDHSFAGQLRLERLVEAIEASITKQGFSLSAEDPVSHRMFSIEARVERIGVAIADLDQRQLPH